MIKKNDFRKVFIVFLASFFLLVNGVSAASVPKSDKLPRETELRKDLKESDKQYTDSDKVRILVEMEAKPAIDEANKRGVMFKDLPASQKENLHNTLIQEQKKVKDKIKSKNVDISYKEEFTTVVNGFSAEAEFGSLETIEGIDNVSNVYIVNEYERPDEKAEMIYSKELVQAQEAWRDYGFKGEGMVIGIIDTGIDPNHKDMVLSPETNEKFSENYVNLTADKFGLDGKYYTEKVPFGYNYMDKNDTILDIGSGASMHGMHVGGTAAANGDEENGGIKGVAPEAQLLALKVFGNDPEFASTYGDIYVKAIDDAITLGADVLNLSLGSTAGFVNSTDPEQMAVKRATENGIMVAISAGNSAHFGNGYANPLASNPDIGVSGSPGVSYESLQVSSLENSYLDLSAATALIDGAEWKFPYMTAGNVDPATLEQKTFQAVDAGLGGPDDFAGKDLTGKFALIKRGTFTFVEKTVNAQNAGAAGVIIYNNTNGFISMATDASIRIPQLAMLKTDGEQMVQALADGKEVTLSFEGDKTTAPNPEAGKMSSFTSWGLTPNLDFKPEITAPGGNIYSTLNDDQYGMMSGTSMAAPHVAGGSALVLQRVDEEFDLKNSERMAMTKSIMMNTSSPVIDKGTVNTALQWNTPYSPRRQGAGVMQLHAALSTPVVVTEAKTGESKAALKEVGDKFSFELHAKNYSDEAVTYDVAANIQTDLSGWGELGYDVNGLEAQPLENVSIKVNGEENTQVEIPAGQTVNLSVTADVSEAKVVEPGITESWNPTVDAETAFPNGYFVEGFVTLKDVSDHHPSLTVPYVGFKGDWNAAPVVDDLASSAGSFYGYTGLLNEKHEYLGYNEFTNEIVADSIAISPNGDGVNDKALPVFSLLRNAKIAEYHILDSEGKSVRKMRTEKELRKHYFDGSGPLYTLDPVRAWDGKVNNKIKEGDYFYEIKTTIDFEGAAPQSKKIPVKIDLTKPAVQAALEENNLTISAEDNENGSGIAKLTVLVNGDATASLPAGTTEYVFEEALNPEDKVSVKAVDYAGNEAMANAGADLAYPSIHVLTPEALSVHNSKEVELSGYVADANGMESLTIADREIALAYNEETKRYEFKTTLTFEEDGVHEFTISGKSVNGKELSFNRTVIIDTAAPVLEVQGAPETVGLSAADPVVSLKVEDNFDELRVHLNGNEIFYQEFKEPFAMRSISKLIEGIELPLEEGSNEFEFTAVDYGGNKTTKMITITKLDHDPENGGTPEEPGQPSQGSIEISGKTASLKVDGAAIEGELTNPELPEVTLNMTKDVVADDSARTFKAELDLATMKKFVENKKGLVLQIEDSSLAVTAKSIEEIVKKSKGKVTVEIGKKAVTGIGKGSFLTDAYEFSMKYENKGLFGKIINVPVTSFKEAAKMRISIDHLTEAQQKKAQSYRQTVLIWTKEGGQAKEGILEFASKAPGTFAVK